MDKWRWGEPFQIQTLGMMLRDPAFLPTYSDVLQFQYFENADLSRIAYMVISFYQKYGTIPTRDTVVSSVHDYCNSYRSGSLEDVTRLLHWVTEVYNRTLDEDFVREKVVSFGREQKFRAGLQLAIAEMMKHPAEGRPDDRILKAFSIIEEAQGVGDTRDMGIDFTARAEDGTLIDVLLNSPTYTNKVPTGVPSIDNALCGGLGAGQIGIIGAGVGIGKSTILSIFGSVASTHFKSLHTQDPSQPCKSIIHVTCEVSAELVAVKYAANVARTSLSQINPSLSPESRRELTDLLASAAPSMSKVYVRYFPMDSTSVEDIKWYIQNLIMSNGIVPGLIIVDYADHIRYQDQDPFHGMGRVYKQLISVAKKFQCPMWTASQTKRDYYNADEVDSKALAESWKKAELADVTAFLIQSPEEKEKGVARIFLDKVRTGAAKRLIHCWYLPDKVFLKEMTPEEAERFKPVAQEGKRRGPAEEGRVKDFSDMAFPDFLPPGLIPDLTEALSGSNGSSG